MSFKIYDFLKKYNIVYFKTESTISNHIGRGNAIKIFPQTMSELMNELVTRLFVEQPQATLGLLIMHNSLNISK